MNTFTEEIGLSLMKELSSFILEKLKSRGREREQAIALLKDLRNSLNDLDLIIKLYIGNKQQVTNIDKVCEELPEVIQQLNKVLKNNETFIPGEIQRGLSNFVEYMLDYYKLLTQPSGFETGPKSNEMEELITATTDFYLKRVNEILDKL